MGIFLLVVYVLSLLLSLLTLFKDSKITQLGFSYWDVLIAVVVSVIPAINTVIAFIGIQNHMAFIFEPLLIALYKIDLFMSKEVFWRKSATSLDKH